jgi:hypothetical protein
MRLCKTISQFVIQCYLCYCILQMPILQEDLQDCWAGQCTSKSTYTSALSLQQSNHSLTGQEKTLMASIWKEKQLAL